MEQDQFDEELDEEFEQKIMLVSYENCNLEFFDSRTFKKIRRLGRLGETAITSFLYSDTNKDGKKYIYTGDDQGNIKKYEFFDRKHPKTPLKME